MPPDRADPSWDFTNEEIASIASDELHEHRPNRWRGAKSSWRELTRKERDLWDTLKAMRAEDLSIHLYNIHALKRDANATKARIKDINKEAFIPRRNWTAWPLQPGNLPREGLFKTPVDKYEHLTIRKYEKRISPRQEITEQFSDTVLRFAHENFQRQLARRAKKRAAGREEETEIRQSVEDVDEIVSIMDNDGEDDTPTAGSSSPRRQSNRKPYVPTMSLDDEASYALLRPSALHVISLLDSTLEELHHMQPRVRTWKRRSSSEKLRGSGRGRGRPRLPPNTPTTGPSSKGNARGRGRPKKLHVPLEGETHHEMLVRIARQGHRRIPHTEEEARAAAIDLTTDVESEQSNHKTQSDDDDDEDDSNDADTTDSNLDKESNEPSDASENKERNIGEADSDANTHSNDNSDISEDEEEESDVASIGDHRRSKEELSDLNNSEQDFNDKNTKRQSRRFPLRDWRDVLHAASVAGFPQSVLKRTADRCATLFNESITLTLPDEALANYQATGKQRLQPSQPSITTVHQPSSHMAAETESSSSSDNEHAEALQMHRLLSRRSRTPSSREASSRGRSPINPSSKSSARPSRSRSTSSTRQCFCPVKACPRSIRPFDRRSNLRRHMQKVHPDVDPDLAEQDSEDEVHAGVHVDGYLKRIKIRQGRGPDVVKRTTRIYNTSQSNRSSPRKRRASTDDEYV